MDNDPALISRIDQFLALALEVQSKLRSHKEALIAAGWSEPEAWAWCQRIEERMLGKALEDPEEEK